MVTEGIRKIKIQGATVKSGDKLAYSESRMFKSPGKTHMRSPIITKNTIITRYPIRDPRKD
jgi:hypothetical protein